MENITYEEFKKMDIRVGTIREVEPVPDTDKLLRCQVDFGIKKVLKEVSPENENEDGDENEDKEKVFVEEKDIRQIISGIREYYPEYEKLIGKQVLYIVNLEPRMIKGFESRGMLMAVDGIEGGPVFLTPEILVNPGSKVR